MSWSLRPVIGVHLSIREGRLVQKMSRMLFIVVGKFTICSQTIWLKVSIYDFSTFSIRENSTGISSDVIYPSNLPNYL